MGDGHDYDEEAARREVAVYRTAPAARRRAVVREALALDGGETVCSVGCGPGFEPLELAVRTPAERVLGVDESPAMLDLARERRADRGDVDRLRDDVDLLRGDAASLPLADGTADALTAVQIVEYLPDPAAALAEFARVLEPSGRAVVLDTDWRTFVWRAEDDARSRRVLDAWERRCPNPRIGSNLAPLLRESGFTVESVEPFTIVERSLGDSFFGHNLPFVVDYAREHDDLGPDVAEAWERDVRQRDERGETFVSLTQFRYVVRAP